MKETLHKAQSLDNGLNERQTVNKFYVYALICPIDNIIRYVGATKNPESRYKNHLKDSVNPRKREWINLLIKNGQLPVMKILFSSLLFEECASKEQVFIAENRSTIFNSEVNFIYTKKRSKIAIPNNIETIEDFLLNISNTGLKLKGIAELMYPNNKAALSCLSNKLNKNNGRKITKEDLDKAKKALEKLCDEIDLLTLD